MQLVRVLYRLQGFHGLVTSFTNHGNPISRDSQLDKFLVSIHGSHFLRFHLREQQHILYRRTIGQEHTKPVYPYTHSRGWGHTVLQGTHEVVINKHGLIIPSFLKCQLIFETIQLIDRVIQLRVSVSNLLTIHEQLETFRQSGI